MSILFNPNRITYLAGGFGNDKECLYEVAAKLETIVPDLRVYTGSEWSKLGQAVLEKTHDNNLWLHSCSGSQTAEGILSSSIRPDTITFMVPTNELSLGRATVGFIQSTRGLVATPGSNGRGLSFITTAREFLGETVRHPREYAKLVNQALHFEQLAAAVALKAAGVNHVNLVAPREDKIFSSYKLPASTNEEDVDSVHYVTVNGGHSRFSQDPVGMLREAETAPYAIINEDILRLELPERLETPPTISESASFAWQSMQQFAKQRVPRLAA